MADAELTSLTQDIFVAERLAAEAVEKVEAAEGCPNCGEAQQVLAAWMAAIAKVSRAANEAQANAAREQAATLRRRLEELLRKGAEGEGVRALVLRHQEHKRRLSDTENKREAALQQHLTAQQANLLVAGVIQLAHECISSQAERTRMAAGLAALFGVADGGGADHRRLAASADG